MRNRLLTLTGALALLAVLGHYYAKPLLAQVRAALIENVDEPGRNPFSLTANTPNFDATFTVPAAKRYVLEQYAALCNTEAGGSLQSVWVRVNTTAGALASYAVAPGFLFFGSVEWAASGTTRLYAEPGTAIDITANGNLVTRGCSFTLSGYSINLP
ncbi:MAG: hypothetical protein JO336_04020 [Acidobacteriia bacterium]|nr:hypothetical protein [Terriglobia bacterium]MBV8904008.1 hypothetical protein [Terriglobia bacterium]MBV9742514.1 hypothetical protein [Terriglobia bacterium]